jgi:UrcA family protein
MSAIRIIIASALITGAALKAVSAPAEPIATQDVNISIVETADLDLSTEAGRKSLDQRLVIAAREVCGNASDVDLEGKAAVRDCRADVLAKARAKGAQLADRGQRTILVAARR